MKYLTFCKCCSILLFFFIFISCSKDETDNEVIQCTQLSFDIALESQLDYVFTANFPNRDRVIYSWYLDDVLQEEDGATTSNIPDNKFAVTLAAGAHEICIILEENCVGTKVFCRQVNATITCLDLSYKRDDSRLIADFEAVNSYPEYVWTVDGVNKKTDGTSVDGSNIFDLIDLSPGTYEICLKTPNCDATTDFCMDILIEEPPQGCPVLSYARDGNILRPNFAGYQTLASYSWFVNDIEAKVEGDANQRDNQFDLTSLADGSYNICIKSTECTAAESFCTQVDVGIPLDCTPLSYEVQDNEVLIANFPGVDTKESYDWYVNGAVQESDGIANNGDNQFDMSSYQSGVYNVCILTTGCNTQDFFCSEVLIGDQQNLVCPKLSYEQQGTILKANFTGIDSHDLYIWAVDGKDSKNDGISVSGNNSFDLNALDPGTYSICIYSPGCAVNNYYCNTIVVN